MITQTEIDGKLERHTDDFIKSLIPRSISETAMGAYAVFEASIVVAIMSAPDSELKTKVELALTKLHSTFCP